MKKVIIHINPAYDPFDARRILNQMGVTGPILQEDTEISCMLTEAQVDEFRNRRGTAHRLVEVVEPKPVPAAPVAVAATKIEPGLVADSGDHAKSTTDKTLFLLEEIRMMCIDAIAFIPGHVMKPEYQEQCEDSLLGIAGELERLGFRDFAQEETA